MFTTKNKTLWLAIGTGFAGAATALLLAPQRGKKTRRDLKRFGVNAARRGKKLQRNIRWRAQDAFGGVKSLARESLEVGNQIQKQARRVITGKWINRSRSRRWALLPN